MKIIRFFSERALDNIGQPTTIKSFLPKWYREAETTFIGDDGTEAPGLKKCAPYMDALLSGYTLVTPVDIFVSKNEDGSLKLGWNGPGEMSDFVSERPKNTGHTMPRPAGHHPNHLVWRGFWGIKTPRGWSILMTHPLNRFDLPFTTTSGIIDSDMFSASGNIPFFIREDFSGVIPAGTPIAQLIPIKRASWKMVKNDKGLWNVEHEQGALARNPETNYKKTMWKRKEYN
jgi:hypothetical protein